MVDPTHLARLHAAAFAPERPWSGDEMTGLLAAPGCFGIVQADGFALGRVVADEAELLTLAVVPHARRTGLGRRLLTGFEAKARKTGAKAAFLEVAADNIAALGLYESAGWAETGRRNGYYARKTGPRADAVLMRKALT